MKKTVCLALCAILVILSAACGTNGRQEDPEAAFYYLRDPDTYLYGSPAGVVSSEIRDTAGHEGDLDYLLMLYLQGPLDEDLESPFPAGCRLLELTQKEENLTLVLNSNIITLKGMDLTLACVCLARTCFSVTDARTVRIMAKAFDGTIAVDETITIDSLLLEDTALPTESTT